MSQMSVPVARAARAARARVMPAAAAAAAVVAAAIDGGGEANCEVVQTVRFACPPTRSHVQGYRDE